MWSNPAHCKVLGGVNQYKKDKNSMLKWLVCPRLPEEELLAALAGV